MSGGNVAKIIIVSAVRTDSVGTQASAPTSKNGSLLLVDVLWKTEFGTTRSNPLYFNVKDAEVCKGDVELYADSTLPSGEVKVGDKSHGLAPFDMAPWAATVVIREPLLQEVARIQIPDRAGSRGVRQPVRWSNPSGPRGYSPRSRSMPRRAFLVGRPFSRSGDAAT